jgi:hypothetical protein
MALSKFGAAFKAARKAGKKEFSFGGKSYNTKVKGEDDSSPKKVPTPTAKPSQESAKSGASRSTAGKVTEKKRDPAYKEKIGPKPAKAVSAVIKKGSGISKAVARKENAPVTKEKQGPTPMKDVGIARKGSAISREKARQDNRPTQSTADMLKKRPIRGK